MLGRLVIRKRLFLRTLQIYLASDAPGARGPELWCEPGWNLRAPGGLVVGSHSIESPTPFDDDGAIARADASIARASLAADRLLGLALEGVDVDATTHAITLRFGGDVVVETFSDDTGATAYWVMRDPETHLAVHGTPRGVRLGSRDAIA